MKQLQIPSPSRPHIGAAYVRVSTNDQLELSPESQLKEIQKYAKENHILIKDEFIFMEKEGRSGKRAGNRPEFQKMIATAKAVPKPFDVILVWKFSRFARNQDESSFYKGMLRKKLGIDIQSVSEPILDGMYGRLIELIIEWQDEFYSYNLSAEVRRGMEQKALGGGYQSACPYGYRHSVTGSAPIVVEEEAAVVRIIFYKYMKEHKSFSAIARELNEMGYKTKRNNAFEGRTISYILKNPFYTGQVCWNRNPRHKKRETEATDIIISKGCHEALITEAEFEKVQQRFAADTKSRDIQSGNLPAEHSAVRDSAARDSAAGHFLSGLLKCPICGAALSYNSSQSPCFQCWKYTKGLHSKSVSISEKKFLGLLKCSLIEIGLTDVAKLLEDTSVPSDFKKNILRCLIDKIMFDRKNGTISFYYRI